MTVIFLDPEFNPLSAPIDDFRSLVWTRNYFEHDTFSLVLSGGYFVVARHARYLWAVDTGRLGLVLGVRYSDEGGRRELVVTGKGAEALLDLRCTLHTTTLAGELEPALRDLLIRHALTGERALPGVVLDAPAGVNQPIRKQVTGKPLGEIMYETLMPFGLSYYVRFDPDEKKIFFGLWSGKDRTQSQSQNTFSVFSSSFGNLLTTEYVYDREGYYNFAYVAGEETGANRVIVEVDHVPEGEERREVFIDARDLRSEYTDENGEKRTLSANEYREVLRQRGIEKLAEMNYKESVNAEVDVGVLRYGVDFDLGDICEVVNSDISLTWTARITSIDEVFESDKMRVVPRFGEKISFIDVIKREVLR